MPSFVPLGFLFVIQAYKRKDGFLATQSPMQNTVVDFWRMVYDYNARVIVMLNSLDADEVNLCHLIFIG